MNKIETFSSQVNNIRRRAVEKAAQMTQTRAAMSPEEILRINQELRVHQIELEMQNEELRTAQKDLEAARKRYFDLYDKAPVGYCIISEEGLILEANFTAAMMLDDTRNELVKQPFTRFIFKEDQDIYYLHSKQLFKTGEPQTCELRMVEKNGEPFWTRLEAIAVKDNDGASVCRVVMSDMADLQRNDAEKKELEAQNRQMQKAKSLGLMAGAIAHHFNNQLHVVLGSLEMAVMNLPVESGVVKNLTDAMAASRKAAAMSSLMLTYLGQSPGIREPMDLSEACRRSLILLQVAAPKGALLKFNLPALGPVIHANAGQIQQVLINLVTNAWECAEDNRRGAVLTVKTVSQADVLALKHFPGDWHPRSPAYASLEVADAGCGIGEENLEKIFDPFYSTKFTGRGLGLSEVLGIVRAHDGAVAVESSDRGSVFRVFFPLSAEEVLRRTDTAVQSPETEECSTVLVVEDEEMVRKMTVDMLRHIGFRVLEAKDGVEAVEVFQRHSDKICCVICDLTMPRMDGWETLAALRGLSSGIPFVLSSGYDKEKLMLGDHTDVPDAFLGKPYQLKELGDTIRRVLANKSNVSGFA
jgi:two-component system, cell cycle sensor histidine kinase and response regulator CckA